MASASCVWSGVAITTASMRGSSSTRRTSVSARAITKSPRGRLYIGPRPADEHRDLGAARRAQTLDVIVRDEAGADYGHDDWGGLARHPAAARRVRVATHPRRSPDPDRRL